MYEEVVVVVVAVAVAVLWKRWVVASFGYAEQQRAA
jgi:hypothetical protein